MPYWITPQCSGNETICEDACPYDCVQTADSTRPDGRRHLQIDAQFCVDCGACAIACPENAIAYAGAYQPMTFFALGQAAWMRPLPQKALNRTATAPTRNAPVKDSLGKEEFQVGRM